jgi:elongation factor 2
MGELHLEVALSFLKQRLGDVELNLSAPIAAYRESILIKGEVATTQSPNKRNRFWVQVRPHDSAVAALMEKHVTSQQRQLEEKSGLTKEIWDIDERANVLVSANEKVKHIEEVKSSIVEGFHWACRNGPLCEQPMRGVMVTLVDTRLDEDPAQREPVQIMRGFSRAVLGSFLTAKPVLLEPIYRIEVSTPLEWLGTSSNIITQRRGKIEATDQKGALAFIRGYVPVAQTLGFSSEIRSATSGRVFWQLTFDRWENVPEKLSANVIRQLREKRGLPPDIPQPRTFADEV